MGYSWLSAPILSVTYMIYCVSYLERKILLLLLGLNNIDKITWIILVLDNIDNNIILLKSLLQLQ